MMLAYQPVRSLAIKYNCPTRLSGARVIPIIDDIPEIQNLEVQKI